MIISITRYVKSIVLMILIMSPFSLVKAAEYHLISEVGTSARQIALGHLEGFSQASNSIFENPAGLYRTSKISISAFSVRLMDEVKYSNIALSSRFLNGHIAAGFMQVAIDNIPETACPAEDDSACRNLVTFPVVKNWFDYNNSVYKLAYQWSVLEDIEVAASVVYYRQSYYKISGAGSNIDLGFIYRFNDKLEASLLLRNVIPGQSIHYNQGDPEPLPVQHVLSLRQSLKWGIDIYPQIKWFHYQWLPSIGIMYKPNFFPYVHFMSGYKAALDVTQKRHNRIAFGIGLQLMSITINYAYERTDYILNQHKHYASITANF